VGTVDRGVSLATLRELYLGELHDLYDAEQQVLRELPLLSAKATADELREAFDGHYRQTLEQLRRLDNLFWHLDERARPSSCRPLRAIIEDGRLRTMRLTPGAALDAALIAFGQRLEHFEIAAYRCAHAYAVWLADASGAEMLQETLAEEGGMDQRLMELAVAGSLMGTSQLPRV
jgi:ferritin-like metal-binding protein YciE